MQITTEIPNWLYYSLPFIVIWTMAWKGFALWRAANNQQKWWFIVLLLVNTVGILEIIYLFFFSKKKTETVTNEV